MLTSPLLTPGSVAAIKAPQLCEQLARFAEVRVISTSAARYFFTQEQLPPQVGQVLGVGLKEATSLAVVMLAEAST